MDILSISNGALRYHKSALNLSVVCEYSNNAGKDEISTNFAILPTSKSFLKFWRILKNQRDDSCLEVWRVKKDNENEMEMIRKTKATGLSAVAANNRGNQPPGTCALGYLSGEIKIRQLTSDFSLVHHFKVNQSSIMHLDYNCSNENIASTHENGSISIYSLATFVKYDTIKLDSSSTLSRFHPSRKAALAIASYQGTVTLFDTFAKKIIYKETGAHSAPCADVSFSESYLLSCGYDGTINIFDIRKRKIGLCIKGTYGWTSIAMSKCGAYCVGGNMKGELVSYDMRNIKKPLACARVENASHKITRVDFLSKTSVPGDEHSTFIDFAIRESFDAIEQEFQKSPKAATNNDSLIEDIVEFQRGRISDFSSSAVNYGTRISTGSCGSDLQPGNIEDFENVSPLRDETYVNKNKRGSSLFSKRRSSLMTPNLQQIHEENNKENDGKVLNTKQIDSSTPSIKITPVKNSNNEDVEVEESFKSIEDSKQASATKNNNSDNFDMRKEFNNLKEELCEKIRLEVGMLNFDEENRYVKVMSQIVNQRQRLQERVGMIEECMAMLLNDDFKMNRIMELQSENDELRAQIEELARRMTR